MLIQKILTFFSLLTICITTIGQIKTEVTLPDNSIVFKTDSIEGVIFGEKFKIRHVIDSIKTIEIEPLKIISKGQMTHRFVPDIKTIVQIEKELKFFIRDSDIFIADSLHCYTKQYLGYTLNKNDTIIYINCFYDKMIQGQNNWHSNLITVFDGWHYFFNVKYNVTTKRFFDLWINGWG